MDPTYHGLSNPVPVLQPKKSPPMKLIFIILGVLVIIGLGLVWFVNSQSGNIGLQEQRLRYRIDALNSLTDDAKGDITDGTLSKINADLSIVLKGDIAKLDVAIPAAKSSNELKVIAAEETDDKTTTTLEDAKLNGQFDSTYKTTLMAKVNDTYMLAKKINDTTKSKSKRDVTTTIMNDLKSYYTQLSEL